MKVTPTAGQQPIYAKKRALPFSVIAYFLFDFLYKLITYTRVSVYSYGIGSTFVSKTNDDVNSVIAAISHNISQNTDEASRIQPLPYLATILIASVGVGGF